MTTLEVIMAALVLLAAAALLTIRKKAAKELPLASLAFLFAAIEVADRLLLGPQAGVINQRIALVLDSLLPSSALWYSFSFARSERIGPGTNRGIALFAAAVLFPAAALFAPIASFLYSPDLQAEHVLFLRSLGYWFYLGLTLSCVAALVNIEATFSSSSGSDRWRIKFEIIGASTMLAGLIFYFSQALLYRTIDANLLPVRSCILAVAAGLVLFSKLFRGNGVRVAVSRYVLYRAVTLAAVGVYFVILGLIGEGMKYFEFPFGSYLVILVAFAGGIGLLAALLSEKVRRSFKVFLSKHFLSQKHDYRQTWLHLTRKLASHSAPGDRENAIPDAFREIFGLRDASLYLLESRTGRYTRADKSSPISFPLSPRLLSYFLDRNRVWNPGDGEYRPTDEELGFARAARARLIVPLICNNRVEGLVTFGESITSERFTYEDYDLMKIIARQSGLLLTKFRLSEELIEARELAAIARVSSFAVHDLKNLTHSLSLIMDNAEEHIGNAEFQKDMMITLRHTVDDMTRLTRKLKEFRAGSKPAERLDLRLLSETIVRDFTRIRSSAMIICRGDTVCCTADREEIGKVIVNLVQNGLDAAGREGMITVETGFRNGRACLQVSDNGCGMTKEFIQRQLFKPFRSTKQAGLGIGLYQCRQIIESFGGTIEAASEPGKGSRFTVFLPACDRGLTVAA